MQAESARQHLNSLRALTHSAVDVRFDELIGNTTLAENIKISTMERELLRVDDALEQTKREYKSAREAAKELDDDGFAGAYDAILAKLSAVDAANMKLPIGYVEPALLRLDLDIDALLNSIRTAGTVIAPRGVSARDVVVRDIPKQVWPGRPLQFELALSDDYPSHAPAELDDATASLALHAQVDVSIKSKLICFI